MKPIAIALLAGALLVPAATFAQNNVNSQPSMQPYAQGPANESNLIREVRHQLVMLPYYTVFDDLSFRVEGNTVILEGEVTNPVLKSDAGNVVKRVEGVGNVVNNIKVLPLSPMDSQIRRAVARKIYGNPTLSDRYGFQAMPSIHIIVDNGHVTLKGVVANQMDKQIAGMQANTVPNVFSVQNDLMVEANGNNKK
jgi:hyperosmotically inducible protein